MHEGRDGLLLRDEVWFFLRLETMGFEQKTEFDLGCREDEGLMLRSGGEREWGGRMVPMRKEDEQGKDSNGERLFFSSTSFSVLSFGSDFEWPGLA